MKTKFLFALISIFSLASSLCKAQKNYVHIPDSILYENIKREFNHNDSLRTIDTTTCKTGYWVMIFQGLGIKDFYGVQFLKCLTGSYCFGSNHQKELKYYPPKVGTLDCKKNEIRIIDALPEKLTSLIADDNLLEQINYLPEGLIECSIKNNRLKTLPALPKSLRWLNYMNNPIDTALLAPEYKDNPCLYRNQNCLPKKKKFDNLFNIRSDSSFDVNKIRSVEIEVDGSHAWAPDQTLNKYHFTIHGNKFVRDSIVTTRKNSLGATTVDRTKATGDFTSVKRVLKHILQGDKLLPLSDVKQSDTSTQIIDFYSQFEGECYSCSSCGVCSRFVFTFTFVTDKSSVSISAEESLEDPQIVAIIHDNLVAFDTKKLAEWMYCYALASKLVPDDHLMKIPFDEKNFMLFKNKMHLR